MPTIVYQTNAKGIRYAYESTSYWDKDKKRPRTKRKYICRVDPETGRTITKQVVTLHISVEVTEYRTPEFRNQLTGQRVHADFPDGLVDVELPPRIGSAADCVFH